jgi:hypothetical protein
MILLKNGFGEKKVQRKKELCSTALKGMWIETSFLKHEKLPLLEISF